MDERQLRVLASLLAAGLVCDCVCSFVMKKWCCGQQDGKLIKTSLNEDKTDFSGFKPLSFAIVAHSAGISEQQDDQQGGIFTNYKQLIAFRINQKMTNSLDIP